LNRLLKNGAFVVKARVSLSKNEEMGDDVLPLHYLVSWEPPERTGTRRGRRGYWL